MTSSTFQGRLNVWGCLYFLRLPSFVRSFSFWRCLHFWGSFHFWCHLHFWICLHFLFEFWFHIDRFEILCGKLSWLEFGRLQEDTSRKRIGVAKISENLSLIWIKLKWFIQFKEGLDVTFFFFCPVYFGVISLISLWLKLKTDHWNRFEHNHPLTHQPPPTASNI